MTPLPRAVGRCRACEPAGFDVLSLANNHVGDYGDRALRQTLDRFCRRRLRRRRRPQRRQARGRSSSTRNGVRVGFLATDSIGETPAATPSRPGTNRLDMPPRTGPMDRGDLAPDHRRYSAR